MSVNEAHFRELFRKYSENVATAEERTELFQLIREHGNEQVFEELMLNELESTQPQGDYDQLYWDHVFNELMGMVRQPEEKSVRPLTWSRLTIAASLLIGISVAAYFVLRPHESPQFASQSKHDVAPYTAMAILKTRGKTIVLDTKGKGIIAQNKQTSITKAAGEELTYTTGTNEIAAPVYDTIQIPAGGRPYRVNLPDGSKILLNAATSLRLPENFNRTNNSYLELITGEAYFDIAHNSHGALKIKAPGQLIEDIGTRFDVISYPDDDYKTILVEGLVMVNNKALAPGEQATLLTDKVNISAANIEQVLAWTNGYFRFNGEKIQTIMKQLSRWYNIEVKYEGKITNEGFYGKVSRSKNISEVLRMLEKTKFVHFKIEGRRITVLSRQ